MDTLHTYMRSIRSETSAPATTSRCSASSSITSIASAAAATRPRAAHQSNGERRSVRRNGKG